MSRYRKVDPRIWNDEKFRGMSNNGKLVFFMLLTHPHMTAIGAMRATVPGLAAEMGWAEKAFREAFGEALSKGMAKHDEGACFLALPRFLKYNPPESPNVVKAWASALDLLPECQLKIKVIQDAKAFAEAFGKAFGEALPEAFAKAMPYQEQEQEQEQEEPLAPSDSANRSTLKVSWSESGFQIPDSVVDGFLKAYPAVAIDDEIAKAHAWVLANPKNKKSQWGRFLNGWLDRAQNKAPRVPDSGKSDPRFAGMI